MVLFDLGHSKKVNDTHGLPASDAVLRAGMQRCAGAPRSSDLLGRLSEELAVSLP